MTINIVAYNIHAGGGAILLKELLLNLPLDSNINLWLDSRLKVEIYNPKINIIQVKATILGRLCAEFEICKMVQPGDIHFIFGNLPPLFKSKSNPVVYVQNMLLLEMSTWDYKLLFKRHFRLFIEKIWFKKKAKNAAAFVVQTESMVRMLRHQLGNLIPIYKFPFSSSLPLKTNESSLSFKPFDYLYPASGERHKNHLKLLSAWIELSKNGIYPSLLLTLSETNYADLLFQIKSVAAKYGLNIENRSDVGFEGMSLLYQSSKALIYPSLCESFGLPLLEAGSAGLDIVASELDYVRDVAAPIQSFDPNSEISIARAVERHIRGTNPTQKICQAKDLISFLKTF